MPTLKNKIAALPEAPGVYIFKDAQGKIIYIGKAKVLKKRVQSYFNRPHEFKTQRLVSRISDIEYRLTPTESLALILEASIIHQFQPKYNVVLRDDKSFPLVKITDEKFPVICITRKKAADGARYFGPYTSATLLKEALKIIRRKFPYRSCKEMPGEACMYYRIGLSPAPCIGKVSPEEYQGTIENIILILEGRNDALIKKLSAEMHAKAKKREFEDAAKIRDQINTLSAVGKSFAGMGSRDELQGLKKLLNLNKLPQRIEAFDISNIYGKEATGSLVTFYRGIPDKDHYRRFRIKTVKAIDDYQMLREVLARRYARLREEKLPLPDLILVDGGKGHLSAATQVINALGLKVSLASIAKDKENIYTPNRKTPLRLDADTPALNLIRRVRDEAHRFAVSYHHILRRKKVIGE